MPPGRAASSRLAGNPPPRCNGRMTENRVLIAGAGPAGLVAAAVLADEGIPVTIVEQARDLPDDRAGADLPDLAVPRPAHGRYRDLRPRSPEGRHEPSLPAAMRAVA